MKEKKKKIIIEERPDGESKETQRTVIRGG